MRTSALIVAALLSTTTLSLSACSLGPTDRRDVCTSFDELGQDMSSTSGTKIFDDAGDLANLASRYSQHAANLTDDATELSVISEAESTTILELKNATTGISRLCGHTVGSGTTSYLTGSLADSGNTDTANSTETAPIPDNSHYSNQNGNTDPGAPDTVDTDDESAHTALQQEADADRSAAEDLLDHWVPQLSSRAEGRNFGGATYDARDIWENFAGLKRTYPDALLVWSGDYSTFRFDNYWVTILPRAMSTSDEANAWCDNRNIATDDCFAKLISHTAGREHSTVLR